MVFAHLHRLQSLPARRKAAIVVHKRSSINTIVGRHTEPQTQKCRQENNFHDGSRGIKPDTQTTRVRVEERPKEISANRTIARILSDWVKRKITLNDASERRKQSLFLLVGGGCSVNRPREAAVKRQTSRNTYFTIFATKRLSCSNENIEARAEREQGIQDQWREVEDQRYKHLR